MKVLVITNLYPPEFLGGYELGCAQMVEALRGAGHEVRVLTSVSAPAGDHDERAVDRILELPPIYNADRMDSVSPSLHQYFQLLANAVNPANARAIGQAIVDFQPDVAYLWNVLGLGGLGVLALLDHQGVPWVWHIMDIIPRQLCGFGTTGPELSREFGRLFPGRYIACSDHVVGELRAGGMDLGEHIHVIPNWVHGDPPAPRTEFFAGGELRMVSASGELCEPKGTHILIEMAARLRDQGFGNFSIDIYGREDDPRFRAMLFEHSVNETVRLMGERSHSDLLKLYSGYDVFVFPTWSREPFGFAPLEAAAAGCAPMFSDGCGIAEWLIDGVDCMKAPRTVEGFAERVGQVLRQEIDLPGIARRGQAVAWREFHISAAATKVEAVLADAAGRRAPRGRPGEFFALARFAEGLVQVLLEEAEIR
jgi:glycogen(starch) synthase